MIPVRALISAELIFEMIPPLLVKKNIITDRTTPMKNIISIILTENNRATRYVMNNSMIKAAVIIRKYLFLKKSPPFSFTYYIYGIG